MTCYTPQALALPPEGRLYPFYPCNISTSDGYVPCCQPSLGRCMLNLACSYNNPEYDHLYRGGCTDPTFRSPNCPQFCLTGSMTGDNNFIRDCGNGTGCCDLGEKAVCNCSQGAEGLLALGAAAIVTLSVSNVSSTTSSSTTSNSITSSSITSTLITSSSMMSSPTMSSRTRISVITTGQSVATIAAIPIPNASDLGIKIGVPVGVILGVLVLLNITCIVFWKRSRQRRSRKGQMSDEPGLAMDEPGVAID